MTCLRELDRKQSESVHVKRTVPLNSKAMEAVQHLKKQQVKGCSYVFVTQCGEHAGYRHLLTTMENACEAACVEHRGMHAMRHSFVVQSYVHGQCCTGTAILSISLFYGLNR